jgi:hypothetical protein
MLRAVALTLRGRQKNRLILLGGVFQLAAALFLLPITACSATNLSLGTSLNNRYRFNYCQAPILIF